MTDVACSRDGVTLAGQPFFLLAGQVHYFRFPPAEWRAILLSARAAGLNTIDFVIPWNLHEPQEGHFDFNGLADLPAFIDLCHSLGLKVIARPGPYICAEWENGGIPNWLAARPGIAYRLDDPAFLAATLRWFDVLIPLLAARQAERGGPIILVQIENEHWASGVYGRDAHQATLAQALRQHGIAVPLYTCMGALPGVPEFRNGWSGLDRKLQETRRAWPDNPLIVSELWSGWFDNWGASRHNGKTPASLDLRLHELTAIGVSGLSHWMWAGGSNFGFWGGRTVGGDSVHMTTSYDYDAPVTEFGGLTAKYFVARRHHLFLSTLGSTLAPLLANAGANGPRVLGAKAVAGRAAGGGEALRSVRQGDFGAAFLRNDSADRQTLQVFGPTDASAAAVRLAIEVEAFSIKPVFFNLPLAGSGLRLAHHSGRILGFWSWSQGAVLVIYGFAGEQGTLALASVQQAEGAHWQASAESSGVRLRCAGGQLHVTYWLHTAPIVVQARYSAGGADLRPLTILFLTQEAAEHCWPVPEAGFLIGPHLVAEHHQPAGGALAIETDGRGLQPWYWLDLAGHLTELPPPASGESGRAPALASWQRCAVSELTAADDWQPLHDPRTARPNAHGYAWYRARCESAQAQVTTLAAPGLADRAHLFVDGAWAGEFGVGPDGPGLALPVTLAPGAHDVRLLVDDLGRFNYGGGLGEIKGLTDTLYLGGQQHDISTGWTALWQEAAFAGEALAHAKPAHVRADASNVNLASFEPPPGLGSDLWLLRELAIPPGQRALLYILGDRSSGALFLDGRPLLRFSRHFGGGFFKLDLGVRPADGAPGVLALYLRDYAGLPWRVWLLTFDPGQALPAVWQHRGGVQPPPAEGAEALGDSGGQRPVFYRCRFDYDPAVHGAGPFKLSLGGLRKGQIWLNERNLGRYWQIGPQEFYKVPASWLQSCNELLVFEEEDGAPAGARLWIDDLGRTRPHTVCVATAP